MKIVELPEDTEAHVSLRRNLTYIFIKCTETHLIMNVNVSPHPPQRDEMFPLTPSGQKQMCLSPVTSDFCHQSFSILSVYFDMRTKSFLFPSMQRDVQIFESVCVLRSLSLSLHLSVTHSVRSSSAHAACLTPACMSHHRNTGKQR